MEWWPHASLIRIDTVAAKLDGKRKVCANGERVSKIDAVLEAIQGGRYIDYADR